ncbi:MAG: ADP-ribosylation factor-like protein [Candidatus Jordarchaeum sp.]|uniref:ADP-ribosylation factor-like protein n=1 Tax=Candidatus Jordarchaeum sp. TaxID=2823881 RepID=UPI00404AD2B3
MSFERVRDFLTKEPVDVKRIPKSTPQIIVGISSEIGKLLKDHGVKNVKKLSQQDSRALSQLTGIGRSQLEKWIFAAKILVAVSGDKFRDEKKIILAGLDNSGKTSILNALKICGAASKNGQETLSELRPTEGLQREEMGLFGWIKADFYDLGGLEQYRVKYFEDKSVVFGGTDLLIFVVDAQDYGRYNAALDYLNGILEVYGSLCEIPYTAVFLNKLDAEVSMPPDYGERLDLLKKNIAKIFRKHRSDRFHVDVTSVFETEKLFLSFSTALRKIAGATPVIEGILRDYGDLLESKDLMLFDDKALLIADYTSSFRNVLLTTTMRMIWLREMLTKNYSMKASTMTVELGPDAIIVCKPTDWDDKTVYIAGVLSSTEKSGVLSILGEELQPWIRNIGVI